MNTEEQQIADDWPADAVPLDRIEAKVENQWPGTIKPYRGFATRADYDEAIRQIHQHGGYRVEYTDHGVRTVPR